MIYSDIVSYIQVIRRRWWVIAILFGCTMAVVLVSSITTKPTYRAQVRLQVLAAESQEIYLFSQFKSTATADELRAAQSDFVRQLRSPAVAWQTIADLNLGIGAGELLNRLSIMTDGDYITLVAEADTPSDAEGIATQQAKNALDQYRKIRSLPSTVLLQFINDQLKVEEDQMLKAEQAFLSFKSEHSLEDLSRELTSYQDMIRNLKQQADQATVAQQQALARAAKEREAAKTLLDQAAGMGSSPFSASYLRDQAARYTAAAQDHELDATAQGAAAEQYNKLVAKRQQEMQDLLKLSTTFNALQRQQDQASGNYNFLVSKLNEAELKQSQAENLGFVQVVEPASKPSTPAPSKLGRVAVVAAVVSILAGIMLAFVLEYGDALRKRLGRSWLPRQ